MTTWVISGATSSIAREFGHIAARAGHSLLLVGRDQDELQIMAADYRLRHQVPCETICLDYRQDISALLDNLQARQAELALFIVHSEIRKNNGLTPAGIADLVQVNILSTLQLIHAFMQRKQPEHRLIFSSSIAACRGRKKNSLYGASKAAIEVFLQGLQQTSDRNRIITIARLGFIDTRQTFGFPGIFHASPAKTCAQACWKASLKGKACFYHPFFWRYIMAIIKSLPFFIYRRLGDKL